MTFRKTNIFLYFTTTIMVLVPDPADQRRIMMKIIMVLHFIIIPVAQAQGSA